MNSMRIGAYQFSVSGNVTENLYSITEAAAAAHERGVKLLISPECALTGYPPRDISSSAAVDYEALDQACGRLRLLSREYDMYFIVGSVTRHGTAYHNSALLFGPDGAVNELYGKRALWGWDADNFSEGSKLGVIDIDGWRLGVRICYEIRFPEYFRELFAAHTDLNIVLFYDVSDRDDAARYDMIKAHILTRAVENVTHTLTVNAVSPYQTAPTALFDRSGRLLCEAERGRVALITYDLEKSEPDFGEHGRLEISERLLS